MRQEGRGRGGAAARVAARVEWSRRVARGLERGRESKKLIERGFDEWKVGVERSE